MAENRPPIIAVLGHVDHGKTTLLDSLRKTNVANREVGGITQSIGASVVTSKSGKKITFIDTPGHAAFKQMRSRGAKVADIAILVVAADDGIKPQTQEAIKHILEAKTTLIVALTKIDLNTANVDLAKGQLEKEGILLEGRGGDTPVVEVSAKSGLGLDALLEMIELVTEVSEIKAEKNGKLEAVVIETVVGKRGPTVSVVVRNGSLRVGDFIKTSAVQAKVRGLFDDQDLPVKEVDPGYPALILGFSKLPEVGDVITSSQKEELKNETIAKIPSAKVIEGQLPIVLKAKSAGSLEAILPGLPQEVVAISSSVGDLNDNDIFLAKAAGGIICVFETKIPSNVSKLADTEGVEIHDFKIIYKLFEFLQERVDSGKRKIFGKAKILDSFPFNNKKVAGCRVESGVIEKSSKLVLVRGEEELGDIRAVSLRKQKDEVTQVKEGEEFGIIIAPQLDFVPGDVILSVAK
jgi:translation initiation factor IF-2